MFLSIIIPVYNVTPYTTETIESIVSQDSQDYEIFLINDGSTDGSEKIVDDFAARCDRIRVLNRSSPQLFAKELQKAVNFLVENKQKNKIVVVKSWNEWAQGNYMEPDQKYYRAFLETVNLCKVSDEKSA